MSKMIDVSTPVVLRSRHEKALWFLLGALLLLMPVGAAMIWEGKLFGWLILAFGVMIVCRSAAQLFCPWLYYLRVSSDGFELHGLFRTRRYRWSDVEQFYVGNLGRLNVIRMRYAASFEPRSIWRFLEGALGEQHEGAIVDQYDLSREALAEYLNRWKAMAEQHSHLPT
jgi:hypothetical protein